MQAMSDEELQAQTAAFRARLEAGETLDDLLPEAFATVREAAVRTFGQRHYDVQLIGGIVLHRGEIAEMKTGEGKTLVATLAVYLNALEGKGVHVVTVNDYLAKRDAEWMGRIYRFLGLSVGVIVPNLADFQRRDAYDADITYGTNNELGFDYLRDNMKYERAQMVQRPFNFGIVDEVDSILIDEARTPLIISGPTEDKSELYITLDRIVKDTDPADYEYDEKDKRVLLTEDGTERMERLLEAAGAAGRLQPLRLREHPGRPPPQPGAEGQCRVQARHRLHRQGGQGRHHRPVHRADDGRPALVGRAPPGGRGQGRGRDRAREPDARLDHLPELFPHVSQAFGDDRHRGDRGGGILRHLQDERGLDPDQSCRSAAPTTTTNSTRTRTTSSPRSSRRSRRSRRPASRSWSAPSRSRNRSLLSEWLKKAKVKHEVLNARYHEQEAHIVAQAGRLRAVTIATNMAGRGTDIQLGGNIDFRIADELGEMEPGPKRDEAEEKIREEVAEEKERVIAAGGLFVLGTERHESRRIDNQLRGRSGRQGDPGLSRFYLSLDDDLLRIFGPQTMFSRLMNKNLADGEAIISPWISKAIETAQKKVEARNYDIRKQVVEYDDVMNDQRKVIYEQRADIMDAETVGDVVSDMRAETVNAIVGEAIPPNSYPEQWDIEMLKQRLETVFALAPPFDDWVKEEAVEPEMFVERIQALADAQIAEKIGDIPAEDWIYIEKQILLQSLDHHWKEHLSMLDALRQVVHLRAYAQKKPIDEYKHEAFSMFERMLTVIREDVTGSLARARFAVPDELPPMPEFVTHHIDPFSGDDDTVDIDAGTGAILSRLPPLAAPQPDLPGRRGRPAGQPQRAVPLRLGPQVQALPRGGGVGAFPPYPLRARHAGRG